MKPVLSTVLPIELTNSNDGRGGSFWKSAKVRKDSEKMIRALGLTRTPFEFKAVVVVTRMMRKRQRLWDSSSVLRGNWKELEDSLVACGWFVDDNPAHIALTVGMQDIRKFDRAAVKVDVYDAAEFFDGFTLK